jgi:phosphatidylglycerophosphatase A
VGFHITSIKIQTQSEVETEESDEIQEIAVVAPVRLGIDRFSRWIAVVGGLGYSPVAPGTAGSLAGVLLFLGFVGAVAPESMPIGMAIGLYALAVVFLLLVGIRAAGRAEVDFGRRDDGRIVIDEVVGQLIALAPLVPLLWNIESFPFFFEVVTGFVLFRLFDVWKPGAVRWAERRFEGGLGVMADDVVAGVYAALCLLAIHPLMSGVMSGVMTSDVSERVLSASLRSLSLLGSLSMPS